MSLVQRTASLATATLVLSLVASSAAAQQPVTSFDRLDTRLKSGDTVWVTDTDGREVKGKLRELSPAAMRLDVPGGSSTFEAPRVRAVRTRAADSLGNGILWGALAGMTGGVAVAAGWSRDCAGHDDCISRSGAAVLLGVLGGAAGLGVGAAVDAARPGPILTVYQAPDGSPARVEIAPLRSGRGRGVGVTILF